MSRCFPFPPPGYDLKARPDDVNLIIKDKQKHKKHKEKKDKDKKDRKDNKEKERSVDKHKDDKKRKRKEHREKKDQNKDEQNGENKNVGSLVNPVDGIHDKRAVVELANRVRSKDGATGNHMVQKITVVEKENINLLGKALENGNGMLAANGRSLTIDSRSLGNGLFKVEGSPCQMDTVEKRKEGREMNGHRNNAVEGDGSKNEDKNNNMKAEDKNKEKTKKEMGFTKQETSDRSIRDFHSNQDCQGKLPKLKELNGFLHANGVRSNNMSRPVIASHQAGDEKVNAKHSSPQSVIDNVRSIGHGVKMAMQAPSASLKRKEKVATPMKPPHPDLKYLSKILTVPESVDLPPCDDQEWLFGRQGSQAKRPKLVSPEIQSTKGVWSKAVILESTGTIALPYVIPY